MAPPGLFFAAELIGRRSGFRGQHEEREQGGRGDRHPDRDPDHRAVIAGHGPEHAEGEGRSGTRCTAKPVKSALCSTETITKPQKAGCPSTRRAFPEAALATTGRACGWAGTRSLGIMTRWIVP